VFAQSLRMRAEAQRWNFYEGPPTANGPPVTVIEFSTTIAFAQLGESAMQSILDSYQVTSSRSKRCPTVVAARAVPAAHRRKLTRNGCSPSAPQKPPARQTSVTARGGVAQARR
jgi:hypothetical protein